MNDANEIIWAFKVMDSKLRKSMLERASIVDSVTDLINWLKQHGQHNLFISCFSMEKDLLSQWRAYGDDGKGLALGFNLKELDKDNIYFEKVEYVDKINNSIFGRETVFEVAADTFQIAKAYEDSNDYDNTEIFFDHLFSVLAGYKNKCFAEEKEIRLIYEELPREELVIEKNNAWSNKEYHFSPVNLEHDFRIVNNNITEYVKLPYQSSLKEIVIGPKCTLTEADVKRIVNVVLTGLEINVYKSEASYR